MEVVRRPLVIAIAIAAAAVTIVHARCDDSRHGAGERRDASGSARTAARAASKYIDPRAQARAQIAGRVRDARGNPVPQAVVCADVSTALAAALRREPRCTTTSTDGAYELRELYAGTYAVTASAPTFRPSTHRSDDAEPWFQIAAGERKDDVDLVLDPGGAEITGVVLDIEGGPIAGAWVRARGDWGSYVYSPFVATDANGRFSVWTFPGMTTLFVEADGYASATDGGRAPRSVEVRLTPEATLAGTVVDALTGAPIEGAALSVQAAIWSSHPIEHDRTDTHGRFRARRLLPGRYIVTARTETSYGRTEGSVPLGLGQATEDVVVRLHPAARIAGKVLVSRAPPMPCPGAGVSLQRDEDSFGGRADADGTFVIGGVMPGTYAVRASCPGTTSRSYPAVVVQQDNIDGLVLEVDRRSGATIRGRIATKRGVAVADASLSAVDGAAAEVGHTFSRADGTYAITGLRGGGTYRIGVSIEQFSDDALAHVTLGPNEVREQDLVIDAEGTIQGTLVDERGRPLANATIHSMPTATGVYDLGTATDAKGAFTIPWLRASEYRVTAHRSGELLRKPGLSDDNRQGEVVSVTPGQTTTVKLVVEARMASLRGTVVDERGAPIDDAYVVTGRETDRKRGVHDTRHIGWAAGRTLTNPQGQFELAGLLPGSYTVRAYRNGGGEAIVEHVTTGSSIRMQIRRTAAIEGIATFPGGKIDPTLLVTVFSDATQYRREEQFYRTDGRFTVPDVPPGRLRLVVDSARASREIEVQLDEGERERVTVPLAELVTLTGRVVDAETKQPVPHAGVSAGRIIDPSVHESFRTDVRTDANGRFTLPRIPTGRIELRILVETRSKYDSVQLSKLVVGTGTVDIGDVLLVRSRLSTGAPGELGIDFLPRSRAHPEQWKLQIVAIDPRGAAANTALRVGDVITTIDGFDVTGSNHAYAWSLMHAPRGTKLVLGTARGTTVEVTLR